MFHKRLSEAIHEFILASEADGRSTSTLTWYKSLMGAFERAFPDAYVQQVTANEIRQYIVSVRKRYDVEDTVSAHTRSLHKFWKWASLEYDIPNPMRNIKYPNKPQAKPRAVSLEDIKKMFQATRKSVSGERDRAILAFLLDTGCRAAGLCNLELADLDIELQKALVTEKGNKTRGIVFGQRTKALLMEWMAKREPNVPYVFHNLETLEPLRPNGLYQLLRRLAKRAGVTKFNPHGFRHTFAKEYIKSGGDLATLSRLMGHRDVSTTVSHYTIFTDREIAESHERFSPMSRLAIDDKSKV